MNLAIENLTVTIEGKTILNNLSLVLSEGTTTALMGQNGSGKTTLANTLIGDPRYTITNGRILLDKEDITALPPEERTKKGIFLSYQQPPSIPGITTKDYLRTITEHHRGKKIPYHLFLKELKQYFEELDMPLSFLDRELNQGFSGGEKKRMEILQLLLLKPKIIILDETDSGLDIDALAIIAKTIRAHTSPETIILIITHYQRILKELPPDRVLILSQGTITHTGGPELLERLEQEGYAWTNTLNKKQSI